MKTTARGLFGTRSKRVLFRLSRRITYSWADASDETSVPLITTERFFDSERRFAAVGCATLRKRRGRAAAESAAMTIGSAEVGRDRQVALGGTGAGVRRRSRAAPRLLAGGRMFFRDRRGQLTGKRAGTHGLVDQLRHFDGTRCGHALRRTARLRRHISRRILRRRSAFLDEGGTPHPCSVPMRSTVCGPISRRALRRVRAPFVRGAPYDGCAARSGRRRWNF